MAKQTYAVGRFTLEPRRQLLDAGRPVALGGKALDLLSVLAEAHGALVTKDELMAAVWPDVIIEENAIQVHMSALRKALGDEAGRLVTVRGLGYRLNPSDDYATYPDQGICSIAVLPFVNLTGDSGNDYLADGIADELITTLSRCNGINVSARTSTFAYRGRGTDIRTIARDLGVINVVEGSVRKSGDRLRVTAQLVDAATGFHLWAQSYDRTDADLLMLQDAIAAAIAELLQVKLGKRTHRQADPEAIRLSAQGRALAARVSAPTLRMAIELQERALEIDPEYVGGRVGLAATLMVSAANGVVPIQRMNDVLKHLSEAIRLAPDDGTPHDILAAMNASGGRWIDAEYGFRAAAKRYAEEPTILTTFATQLLAPCGHSRRGLEAASAAVEFAPASTAKRVVCAHLALATGQIDLAREHYRMAAMLGLAADQPGAIVLQAEMARLDGRFADAVALMCQAVQPVSTTDVSDAILNIYSAEAKLQTNAKAVVAMRELIQAVDMGDVRWSRGHLAGVALRWQVQLGAFDDAFSLVDTMASQWEGSSYLAPAFLRQLWRFDMQRFRDDPRFQAVVERFGMIDYWQRFGAPDGYRLVDRQLVREI